MAAKFYKFLDRIVEESFGKTPNDLGWVNIQCPLCEETYGTPKSGLSCGVNLDSGVVKCFRCDSFSILDELKLGILPEKTEGQDAGPNIISPPLGYIPLWSRTAQGLPKYRKAINYALSRKIPKELFQELEVGIVDRYSVKDEDLDNLDEEEIFEITKLHNKLIIPIKMNGKWVGYVGRDIRPNPYMKFCNSSSSWRKHCLWNMDSITRDDLQPYPILLMEGILDAVPYYPYSVASMGKPGNNQLELLTKTNRPVIVCLDGDAWKIGESVALKLQCMGQKSADIRLPSEEDPSSIESHKMWKLIKETHKSLL